MFFNYLIGKTDNPDEVWVYEIWTSKEAHDAALDLPEANRIANTVHMPHDYCREPIIFVSRQQ